MSIAVEGGKLVIFDGECGVCLKALAYLQGKDTRGRLAFLPYQSADLPKLSPGLTADKASKAVYLITPAGNRYAGARAVFATMRELPGVWGWAGTVWFSLPLAWLAEPLYQILARHRSHVSKWLGLTECRVTLRTAGTGTKSDGECK